MNDLLMQLFASGQIMIEDLLENGAFPFADRLLQSIQKRKEEMIQAQGSIQQSPQDPNSAQIPPEIQQQINNNTAPLMLQALQQ